jgi:hypothetical protein
MRVDEIRVESAPERNRVRLVARVQYEGGETGAENYWFEVPEEHGAALSRSGNPWLVALLPLAVHLREPLAIAAPVDPTLMEGAHDLMHAWKAWYPRLNPVEIEAEPSSGISPLVEAPREVCFFSGGVDSSFTVLKRAPLPATPANQKLDLLSIHGLDLQLRREDGFDTVATAAKRVAAEHGCGFLPMATNLRSTRLGEPSWGELSHGCVLAAAGLSLEGRYGKAIISSSFHYAGQKPWGSHPLTDPMLSTSTLRMEHFGCRYSRANKVALLAASESESLLRGLRVCYHNKQGVNCGECRKCYRVMAVLELTGALERCVLFPQGTYSVKRFAQVYTPYSLRTAITEIQNLAKKLDRPDVVQAGEQSLRHSRRMEPLVKLIDRLQEDRRHALTVKRIRRLLAPHVVL